MTAEQKAKYEAEAPKLVVYTIHENENGTRHQVFLTSGNTESECHTKARHALLPEWFDRYVIVPMAEADYITRNWYGLEA